jgi:nucleoid-associated protein YgaU
MADRKQEQIKIGNLTLSEKTISTVLGIIVVLVVGGLVFNYFKDRTSDISMDGENELGQLEGEAAKDSETDLPTAYTVQKGDSLWKISENFYNSGYNWVDIASENNLSNPNAIETGQELTIPNVEAKQETIAVLPETGMGEVIEQDQYTVQKGDWLSKIALRAYGDMFAWEKIYEANKELIGSSPDLIEEGMVLTIPN